LFQYVAERWSQIWFASWQHFSLVVQCVVLATLIAVALAALVYRSERLSSIANGVSAVGLTIPSFALIGLLLVPMGFGVAPAVTTVTFFAVLPILRNAVVGLAEIPPTVVESARGIGMSRTRTFLQVELPMAWPIILTGVRISAQMVMGVAAIAAYALGPGLGGFIFSGLSRQGGANALNQVVIGVVGVVLIAFVLDLLLVGLGRITTSRGIRVQH
jgi:osmoprotectant transport system permease protein